MATNRKYKSDASEAIHSSASALYRVGAIDKKKIRTFDISCLANHLFAPSQIKKLRQKHQVSQREFASYLNTSVSTVEKWETGAKKPGAIALKLLSIVEKHGLEILA